MNPTAPPSGEPPPEDKPRKIRTWWHPLLVSFLRWQLGSHYQIQDEVPVGTKPLQLDILLLRKAQGELPEPVLRVLAGLVEYLGELTLVEFKSPSETLRAGDFQTFLAYALLYRAQNDPLLDARRLHMVVIAPKLTRPYQEELQALGVTPRSQEPGIWRLEGLIAHPTWVLETEVLSGLDHPLLTLFSPTLLKKRQAVYEQFKQAGYDTLMVYLLQQVEQFKIRGEEFAMTHLGAEDDMKQVLQDLCAILTPESRAEILAHASVEERLAGIPPEQRLAGIPLEQRLAGIPPEQRLKGLTPEELERLRQLLQQPLRPEDDSSHPK
jgi:hypothetical protein